MEPISLETIQEINEYLVMIFNEIIVIEEKAIQQSQFNDISVREMHIVEAIGLAGVNHSKEVADRLSITPGTLSVAIQNLVKKDYVGRERLPEDRRVVTLKLTKKGRLIYRLHRKFHLDMVRDTLAGMDEGQAEVLIQGLRNLHIFLEETKEEVDDL